MEKELTVSELETELAELGQSPQDKGQVEMIVCRPDQGQRQVLERAELDLTNGLVGDNWRARGSRHTDDGSAHPGMQLTLMNSRTIQAIAGDRSRWILAGDQLFVDFDLSIENLPPGQRLAIGTAILEVTDVPHNGCAKFTERFGGGATRFVNSKEGRELRRRGINTRIVQPGVICVGDMISKIENPDQA